MEVINKAASSNFDIIDKFEAGLVLTGNEAKTALLGRVNLSRSHVKFIGGELYLVNALIFTGGEGESVSRKLLVHKKQLTSFEARMAGKKLTLIPLRMYNVGRLVKLEVGLARALKKHEKKDKIKARDIDRDTDRALKEFR